MCVKSRANVTGISIDGSNGRGIVLTGQLYDGLTYEKVVALPFRCIHIEIEEDQMGG